MTVPITTTYADLLAEALDALADELRAVKDLAPVEAAQVLSGWVNRASGDSFAPKLARARRLAALAAVDELGTQVAVARRLGISEGAFSQVVTAASERRSRAE